MLPVAPLMIEHRLIERMIGLMEKECRRIKQENLPDTHFLNACLDFIITYADKLHHGKEEDILFRDLAKKNMPAEHKKIMAELIQEHGQGRGYVKALSEARDRYIQGQRQAVAQIIENMDILAKFYPRHIDKEDHHFFIPAMDYLDKKEQESMLNECYEFDKTQVFRPALPFY